MKVHMVVKYSFINTLRPVPKWQGETRTWYWSVGYGTVLNISIQTSVSSLGVDYSRVQICQMRPTALGFTKWVWPCPSPRAGFRGRSRGRGSQGCAPHPTSPPARSCHAPLARSWHCTAGCPCASPSPPHMGCWARGPQPGACSYLLNTHTHTNTSEYLSVLGVKWCVETSYNPNSFILCRLQLRLGMKVLSWRRHDSFQIEKQESLPFMAVKKMSNTELAKAPICIILLKLHCILI